MLVSLLCLVGRWFIAHAHQCDFAQKLATYKSDHFVSEFISNIRLLDDLDAFCKGDVAKMSPKSARLRLKPTVDTLATLLAVTPSCAVAAFKPVSEV